MVLKSFVYAVYAIIVSLLSFGTAVTVVLKWFSLVTLPVSANIVH